MDERHPRQDESKRLRRRSHDGRDTGGGRRHRRRRPGSIRAASPRAAIAIRRGCSPASSSSCCARSVECSCSPPPMTASRCSSPPATSTRASRSPVATCASSGSSSMATWVRSRRPPPTHSSACCRLGASRPGRCSPRGCSPTKSRSPRTRSCSGPPSTRARRHCPGSRSVPRSSCSTSPRRARARTRQAHQPTPAGAVAIGSGTVWAVESLATGQLWISMRVPRAVGLAASEAAQLDTLRVVLIGGS